MREFNQVDCRGGQSSLIKTQPSVLPASFEAFYGLLWFEVLVGSAKLWIYSFRSCRDALSSSRTA